MSNETDKADRLLAHMKITDWLSEHLDMHRSTLDASVIREIEAVRDAHARVVVAMHETLHPTPTLETNGVTP